MSKKMWKKLSTLLLMVVMVLTMSLSVQAAAVKMNKAKATLYPGQKVTLKVTGTSKKAKWSSSNANKRRKPPYYNLTSQYSGFPYFS